jgi:hypothetical protein
MPCRFLRVRHSRRKAPTSTPCPAPRTRATATYSRFNQRSTPPTAKLRRNSAQPASDKCGDNPVGAPQLISAVEITATPGPDGQHDAGRDLRRIQGGPPQQPVRVGAARSTVPCSSREALVEAEAVRLAFDDDRQRSCPLRKSSGHQGSVWSNKRPARHAVAPGDSWNTEGFCDRGPQRVRLGRDLRPLVGRALWCG